MSSLPMWFALGAMGAITLGLMIADIWYDIRDNDWDKDHGRRR